MSYEMLPAELLLELVRQRQKEMHQAADRARLAAASRSERGRKREPKAIGRAARWIGQAIGRA
jgi:hypothetical protein